MKASQGTEWPSQSADSWTPTRETLHRQMQIVGKTRPALSPMICQWWNVAFYVTPLGMTTGPMPDSKGLCELTFDFVRSRLRPFTSDGKA